MLLCLTFKGMLNMHNEWTFPRSDFELRHVKNVPNWHISTWNLLEVQLKVPSEQDMKALQRFTATVEHPLVTSAGSADGTLQDLWDSDRSRCVFPRCQRVRTVWQEC